MAEKEYIEREAFENFLRSRTIKGDCKFCDKYSRCVSNGINRKGSHLYCWEQIKLPTADVVEVRHGKWHIMPEDPEDESECPTEAGWYRIITTDGEEMTDYYFNKPTRCGRGVVYWKNCKKGIRAWAKMDGKGDAE